MKWVERSTSLNGVMVNTLEQSRVASSKLAEPLYFFESLVYAGLSLFSAGAAMVDGV